LSTSFPGATTRTQYGPLSADHGYAGSSEQIVSMRTLPDRIKDAALQAILPAQYCLSMVGPERGSPGSAGQQIS